MEVVTLARGISRPAHFFRSMVMDWIMIALLVLVIASPDKEE